MTTQTPTPNAETPRHVDAPDTPRNDPAIDPKGGIPAAGTGGKPGSDEAAADNSYSPDFAPEPDPEKSKTDKASDIETDGG